MIFGCWNNFLREAGYTPRVSIISQQARINSINSRRGKIGGNNKGGRRICKAGYVQIWMPKHPNSRMAGYIHEHRLVMSNHIGRPLFNYENVHHKDGNRINNELSNLELWDKTQPSGQRVEDKIKWAIEFLTRHNYEIIGNSITPTKNHEEII